MDFPDPDAAPAVGGKAGLATTLPTGWRQSGSFRSVDAPPRAQAGEKAAAVCADMKGESLLQVVGNLGEMLTAAGVPRAGNGCR